MFKVDGECGMAGWLKTRRADVGWVQTEATIKASWGVWESSDSEKEASISFEKPESAFVIRRFDQSLQGVTYSSRKTPTWLFTGCIS
jgi:hypothetical protein